MAVVTAPDAVLTAFVTAVAAVLPVLWTGFPADGLVPLTAPATVPAVALTAEPTVAPVFWTAWATPEAALLTVPCAPAGVVGAVGSAQPAPAQVPFVRVGPEDGLEPGCPPDPPERPDPPEGEADGFPPPVPPVPALVSTELP